MLFNLSLGWSKHMQALERYQLAKRVTLVGALVNALLALCKIVLGFVGNSQGLIADGVHSLADLVTDGLVLFASRFGSQQADKDHPYGHRRIETAATVFVAILLVLTGIGIIAQAIHGFITPHQGEVQSFTLWVAAISIILNELLFHYTLRAARTIRSELLRANAWHHRSDAASSFIVFVGIAGGLLGYYALDGIAAIVVGFTIVKLSWDIGWSSLRELVDTGVDQATLALIEETIIQVPGVKALHLLRNRSMAGRILIDVHVQVEPTITVSEGHYIATKVHQCLTGSVADIEDVTVHIDPEDDGESIAIASLPGRAELLALLELKLATCDAYQQHIEMRLHYLSSQVFIEIYLPAIYISEAKNLHQQMTQALAESSYIHSVQLFFQAKQE
jgi:cation diffusion facilitator family transporter